MSRQRKKIVTSYYYKEKNENIADENSFLNHKATEMFSVNEISLKQDFAGIKIKT